MEVSRDDEEPEGLSPILADFYREVVRPSLERAKSLPENALPCPPEEKMSRYAAILNEWLDEWAAIKKARAARAEQSNH